MALKYAMDQTPLQIALSEPGRKIALARHCNVTAAAVTYWQRRGVPSRYARQVAEFLELPLADVLTEVPA